jgi:hypothetical protein
MPARAYLVRALDGGGLVEAACMRAVPSRMSGTIYDPTASTDLCQGQALESIPHRDPAEARAGDVGPCPM